MDDTIKSSLDAGTDAPEGRPGLKSICVFCGSRMGENPRHREAARELGRMMAERGIRLVYGGGAVGLMGIVAKTVLEHGGEVIGIIPEFLMTVEVGDPGVTELIVVDTMHERKARMFGLSDAFVVLPGGLGTLDETFEIATWKQLQLHAKPIVALNIDGCWDGLRTLLDSIVRGGFAHPSMPKLISMVESVGDVLTTAETAVSPGAELLPSHLQKK